MPLFVLEVLSKLLSIDPFLFLDLLADCVGHKLHAPRNFSGPRIPLGLTPGILCLLLPFSVLRALHILHLLLLQLLLSYPLGYRILLQNPCRLQAL